MLSLIYFPHDILRSILVQRGLYLDIHQGRSTPSWLLVALYCAVYAAYSILAYLAGRMPEAEPWLKIDGEVYYLVQSVFVIPLILCLWLQAAATIHVLGRLRGGAGDFDRTLRMTGYSLWAPWAILLPFDILPTPELLYDLALGVCIFLMLAGTTLAAEIEAGIEWGYAFFFALIAILGVAIMLFALIR